MMDAIVVSVAVFTRTGDPGLDHPETESYAVQPQ